MVTLVKSSLEAFDCALAKVAARAPIEAKIERERILHEVRATKLHLLSTFQQQATHFYYAARFQALHFCAKNDYAGTCL